MSLRSCVILFVAALIAPSFASAATLYLEPDAGTYGPGDTFEATVRLTVDDSTCINAVEADISFPKNVLKAVDFSRGESILSLWVSDPKLDNDSGAVSFQGGIPGGYCGRIPGDPSLSNVLGKIIFTVVSDDAKKASVDFLPSTMLYANDGRGTKVTPTLSGAVFTIASSSVIEGNPWLLEVQADKTPPDPFTIHIESQRGVFRGRYFAAFSAVDKQSGIDHYEIYEDGGWKPVTSPHELRDQSLKEVRIKAIDKAGNERLGTYVPGSAPPRQYSIRDFVFPIVILIVLVIGLCIEFLWVRKRHAREAALIDLRA